MNWDAIGAIGEIVGAAAVVVSLLYLGIQIRAQTRQSKIAAMHEVSAGFRDVVGYFDDAEKAKLFIRALDENAELEEHEQFQLMVGCQRGFRVWEEAYYMHRAGNLDAKNWDGMNRQFQSFFAMPAFKRTWSLRSEFYGEEFRQMVESSPSLSYRHK